MTAERGCSFICFDLVSSAFLILQIQSNLGKIILKEELERTGPPLRRKTRSLPDRSLPGGKAPPPPPPPPAPPPAPPPLSFKAVFLCRVQHLQDGPVPSLLGDGLVQGECCRVELGPQAAGAA